MRAFLKRSLVFMLLPIAVFIAAIHSADGRTDPFYLRFTTPRQSSLVLGDSRAAQGIHPQVLDSILHAGGHAVKLFNYAFSLGNSDYGKAYFESIGKKLAPTGKDGVFVLSVDPWGISGDAGRTDAEEEAHEQKRSLLARMDFVNMRPNVEYLLNDYQSAFLTLLFPLPGVRSGRLVLHENGWLETNIDLSPKEVSKRIAAKTLTYRGKMSSSAFSPWRAAYLSRTIDLLKQHGTVLLVRVPVHSNIAAVEEEYMPAFNFYMQRLAAEKGIHYLAIPPDDSKWEFTDGNHLPPRSGAGVSRIIGEELVKVMK